MSKRKSVLIDDNPGRNAQTYGIARELNTNLDYIHNPSVGVIGNGGDSQCYLGVKNKVEIIHESLRERIEQKNSDFKMRLVQPPLTIVAGVLRRV